MSLNHAPLQTTLDCKSKWNLKMNNCTGEVSIYCVKQLLVWSHAYGLLFIQEFLSSKIKRIANV
jgi:hypothetical protein